MEGGRTDSGRACAGVALFFVLVSLTSVALTVRGSSPGPIPLQWPSHNPILIDGDAGFTPANGVIGGRGTAKDPYEIAMWDIDAGSATGVDIRNTTAFFFLHDVFVHDGGSAYDGLHLRNVANGKVEQVSVTRNFIGMVLESVTALTLNANYADSNAGDGIDITDGSNLLVTGNGGGHNAVGLHIAAVTTLDVMGNYFRNSNGLGFGLSNSADVRVDQNNFSSNGQGMILNQVSDVAVRGNIVLASPPNFVSSDLTNVTFSNNTLDSYVEFVRAANGSIADNRIGPGTLDIVSSANLTVARNDVSGATAGGVILEASDHITAVGNNVSGIRMSSDTRVTLRGNRLSQAGLVIDGVSRAQYASHVIAPDNLVAGRPILYYRDCRGLVLDGVQVGQLFVANCTDVSVAHVDIADVPRGLTLAYVDGGSVVDSNVSTASDAGVFLDTVTNTTFDNVSVRSNLWGILGQHLTNVTVRRSAFADNWNAIYVTLATNVTLADSDVAGKGVGAGFYVQSGTGILAERNRIRNLGQGILLVSSTDVVVRANEISNNPTGEGITASSSYNSVITANNFTNNGVGVDLDSYTHDVVVHHNRFIGNAMSAFDAGSGNRWDDGYPSGGNIWSDYRGWDDCGGPNQDVCPGSDGLGDIPYPIPVSSADRYPLVETNPPNTPPVAAFSMSPGYVFVAYPLTFDATASVDPDGWPLRYDWSFGDGTIANDTGPTVTRTYAAIGNVTAFLKVTDVRGAVSTASKTFRVAAPPVASFTFDPSIPIVDQVVTFDASTSHEPGGTIIGWSWNFGDGTTANGVVATHAFGTFGIFSVTLEVVDDSGYTAQSTRTVSVEPTPPPPLVLVNYESPAGFRLPVPVNWTREENRVINGVTFDLVLLGPTHGSIQTTILVASGYDPSVRETPAYLFGVVNATVEGIQNDTSLQVVLADGPTLRTVGGHAGVTFRLQFGTTDLAEKFAIIVSEAHQRYWVLALTTDAFSYPVMAEGFDRMLAGFEITRAPISTGLLGTLILVTVGIVVGVAVVVGILLLRTRRRRPPEKPSDPNAPPAPGGGSPAEPPDRPRG